MLHTELAKKVVNGEMTLGTICRVFGDNFGALVVDEMTIRSWQQAKWVRRIR